MGDWQTPPEVAKELGTDPAKVLAWIKAGELDAYNLATAPGKRARWRIKAEDLARFLARRRSSKPESKPAPRKRRATADVISFY